MKNLTKAFEKEIKKQAYHEGYDQGVRDAIVTMKSLLQHNNIKIEDKEFWVEYSNLKHEGKIE